MDIDLILPSLGALASLLGTILTYVFTRAGMRAREREIAKQGGAESYRERMDRLASELKRASSLIDATLDEMRTVTNSREESISELESRLKNLSTHEKELQTRVETLRQVPLQAVDYFLQATEKSEKRSARRDYLLFGSGVIVSTIATVLLKLVFGI
jgi:predicted RNase H-like nuclease (RuvC/YqgF family)